MISKVENGQQWNDTPKTFGNIFVQPFIYQNVEMTWTLYRKCPEVDKHKYNMKSDSDIILSNEIIPDLYIKVTIP